MTANHPVWYIDDHEIEKGLLRFVDRFGYAHFFREDGEIKPPARKEDCYQSLRRARLALRKLLVDRMARDGERVSLLDREMARTKRVSRASAAS